MCFQTESTLADPVHILSHAVANEFPACWKILCDRSAGEKVRGLDAHLSQEKKEDFTQFEQSMITLMDIMSVEQFSGCGKLLNLCKTFEQIGASSEKFFYRFAKFVDQAFEAVSAFCSLIESRVLAS